MAIPLQMKSGDRAIAPSGKRICDLAIGSSGDLKWRAGPIPDSFARWLDRPMTRLKNGSRGIAYALRRGAAMPAPA